MTPTKKPFESLTEQAKQPYFDKAAELLEGLLWCDRDWSAWVWGTMNSSDFHEADGDDDAVFKVASALYEFRMSLETREEPEWQCPPIMPCGGLQQYTYGTCEECGAENMYLQAYGHQRDGLVHVCAGCFADFEVAHGRTPFEHQMVLPRGTGKATIKQQTLDAMNRHFRFVENYGSPSSAMTAAYTAASMTREEAEQMLKDHAAAFGAVSPWHPECKPLVNPDIYAVKSGELSDRGKPIPELPMPRQCVALPYPILRPEQLGVINVTAQPDKGKEDE